MKNLRYLPAIDQLKTDIRFLNLVSKHKITENTLTSWLRKQVDVIREHIINQKEGFLNLNRAELTDLIFDYLIEEISAFNQNNLRPVINATGVILHTNLGRAPLSKQAVKQIQDTASSYSTLEYNLSTGKRGSRHDLVEEYLKTLTGAEAAMVVNNNAAAVYLVLKTLASEKEVIVSRGELVEIGGSFRISEIMEESRAQLIDVGTTNKTHLFDYEQAITDDTALLMKVHKSNFKLIGFTEEVDTTQLRQLSKKHQVPIYEDLGSGTLFDFKNKQVGSEPTVQEKVASGIDVISFSGDKLLGGPQAGIIIGSKFIIDKLKKHQLARVLRVDKFTLAGLEATLKSYIKDEETTEIPIIRDILEPDKNVQKKAQAFIESIANKKSDFIFKIRNNRSKIGGGTMPDVEIDTYVVYVSHKRLSSEEIAKALRKHTTPVIVRVQNEAVIMDFRTIHINDMEDLVEAFVTKDI